MTAIEITLETLRNILRHWRQIFRIFLVPLGCFIALSNISIFVIQSNMVEGRTGIIPTPFLFLLFPLCVFIFLWPVVVWHRLLILNETPKGFLPPLHIGPIIRYALNGLGLGILMGLISIPLSLFVFPLMLKGLDPEVLLKGGMPPLRFFIIPTLLSLPVLYFGLRWCLILPGAAVEKHIGISGSWRYTSDKGMMLPLITIFAAGVSLIAQITLHWMTPMILTASETTQTGLSIVQLIAQLFISLCVLSFMSTIFTAFVPEKPENTG